MIIQASNDQGKSEKIRKFQNYPYVGELKKNIEKSKILKILKNQEIVKTTLKNRETAIN